MPSRQAVEHPARRQPLVVAYNVDLFQANAVADPTAAWTWNDCLAAAEQIKPLLT